MAVRRRQRNKEGNRQTDRQTDTRTYNRQRQRETDREKRQRPTDRENCWIKHPSVQPCLPCGCGHRGSPCGVCGWTEWLHDSPRLFPDKGEHHLVDAPSDPLCSRLHLSGSNTCVHKQWSGVILFINYFYILHCDNDWEIWIAFLEESQRAPSHVT